MGEQPFFPIADFGVVVGVRKHPGRRTLKYVKLAGFLGHFWNKLKSTRTGTDYCDALAPKVDVMIPLGRVKCGPAEEFFSLYGGYTLSRAELVLSLLAPGGVCEFVRTGEGLSNVA